MKTNSIYKSTAGREEIMALYNRVLSQWPVPSEHIYISTRYGRTFVIASGDRSAPPLVLLHGSGSNSATWAGDVRNYSPYFRIYGVDIPGEPGRSDPNRFSWDGPAFAEWLDDVLNGLDLENIILGGLSLGGWATLKYAVYKPERVTRAVLICPAGVYPPRSSFMLRAFFLSFLGKWGENHMKRLIFKNAPLSEDVDQFFTLMGRHYKYRRESLPLFTDEELKSLTMPVLYLAGKDDMLLNTPKTAERLQKLVPNLTLNILEEGHAVINSAPRVLPFLLQSEIKPHGQMVEFIPDGMRSATAAGQN